MRLASDLATLPYSWYVDPAIAELERGRIFRRHWQYAGHLGELEGPGSAFPTHVGDLPALVVRDREGTLRAFLNVCRHRGSILVSQPGPRTSIQCPYHAWTYGLDGCLRGAPRSREEPDFEADELGLVPIAVDTWGEFVFLNADPDAPPLAHALGDLPESVSDNGLDIKGLRFHSRAHYEIAANWKIALENYLECYHCPINHPGLVGVIDERQLALQASGLRLSQFAPVHPDALAGRAAYDAQGEITRGQFHLLFPSTKFNTEPGRPNLSIGPVWPVAPDRCHGFLDYWFAPGEDAGWIEDFFAFDTQVGAEDTDLVESVQRGAGSGALEHGRMLAGAEQLLIAFQRQVRSALETDVSDG
jgi:choline monooxygenase